MKRCTLSTQIRQDAPYPLHRQNWIPETTAVVCSSPDESAYNRVLLVGQASFLEEGGIANEPLVRAVESPDVHAVECEGDVAPLVTDCTNDLYACALIVASY